MKAISLRLSRFSHWLAFLSNRLLIDSMAIGQAGHCFSLLWFQHFKELQNQTRKYLKSGRGKLMQKGNQKKLEIYPLSLNSVTQAQ